MHARTKPSIGLRPEKHVSPLSLSVFSLGRTIFIVNVYFKRLLLCSFVCHHFAASRFQTYLHIFRSVINHNCALDHCSRYTNA